MWVFSTLGAKKVCVDLRIPLLTKLSHNNNDVYNNVIIDFVNKAI